MFCRDICLIAGERACISPGASKRLTGGTRSQAASLSSRTQVCAACEDSDAEGGHSQGCAEGFQGGSLFALRHSNSVQAVPLAAIHLGHAFACFLHAFMHAFCTLSCSFHAHCRTNSHARVHASFHANSHALIHAWLILFHSLHSFSSHTHRSGGKQLIPGGSGALAAMKWPKRALRRRKRRMRCRS